MRAYDKTSVDYEDFGNLKLGFNELSDRSPEEFQKMNGAMKIKPVKLNKGRKPRGSAKLPYNIEIDASSDILKNYRSGVIKTKKCGSNPMHTVTVVGVSGDVLTVKNSWGENWGERGTAAIQRGSCGTQ